MVLRTIRLTQFRAHERSTCEFGPSVNLLHGPNGAGKTNVLDAVHYLCLSKGFVTSSDRYMVRRGTSYAEIEGTFARADRRDLTVRLAYMPGEGKRMFVNGAPLDRLSDIVGQLPVVVYSPEDHALTSGAPDERRRFMDNLLSQARPLYLETLMKYRRVLKQRNRLLSRIGGMRAHGPGDVLASWDNELVSLGSQIIAARAEFVRAFSEYLDRAYREIEAVAEQPTLEYSSIGRLTESPTEPEIVEIFREALAESAPQERRRELTLVGPHRDELVFRLDKLLVRRYASQGQHRTFGMALKLAKYFFLRDRTGEEPILLLDDVFDHLDRHRAGAFLNLLQSDRIGQTIITATDIRPFSDHVDFDAPGNRSLFVQSGRIFDESLPPVRE